VIALVAPAVVAATLAAQRPTEGAGAACTREVAWLAGHVARNYAGFADKVTRATQARHDAALAAARTAATDVRDERGCDEVLQRYVRFFADGHLSITRTRTAGTPAIADTSPAALRARFADAPRVALSEDEARRRLERLGARRLPIEGIYESSTGAYRVAVLRDDPRAERPTALSMVVLRADSAWWVPGQVKATFVPDTAPGRWRGTFRLRDHTPVELSTRPVRNILPIRAEPWRRVVPVEAGDLDATQVALLVRPLAFAVHEPAERTLVVQYPNFSDGRAIDSLWRAEGSRLRDAERLVIDLRGNGGGSDANYRQLLPLLWTRPYRSVGADVLATDDNLAAWRALLADSARMGVMERGVLRTTIARLEQGRGDWVRASGDAEIRYPAVLERPRRVDVVIDRGCASSCEQFVLAARESDKVRLFGEPTAGVLDYANVRRVPMPDGTLVLNLPTSRSRRLPAAPVDGRGIAPDVVIPATESDWIGFVLVQPFVPRAR
jgi:hypothetical protein